MNNAINFNELDKIIANELKLDLRVYEYRNFITDFKKIIMQRINEGSIRNKEDLSSYLQAIRKKAIEINKNEHNYFLN